MSKRTIGIQVVAPDSVAAVSSVRAMETLGISAAWAPSPGMGDALTLMTATAAQTERILLGTSVVQIWLRHPVSMAQEAQVAGRIAPGRFRLGIGSGHRTMMERNLGAEFQAPLGHLKEYLQIVKGLLQGGDVEFEGQFYTARATLSAPVAVPVFAAALRPKSFELCGAEADGAISWICPFNYLRDTALPAMAKGANLAGRPVPPLIAHALVCVHEDIGEVYTAARDQFSIYPKLPFYSAMFEAAGFPLAHETGWTNAMLDSVLVCGNEAEVEKGIERIFELGASELLASVITGDHREGKPGTTERSYWRPRLVRGKLGEESLTRTMNLLAQL